MARRTLVLASALLLSLFALAGCNNSGSESEPGPQATESPVSSESASAAACTSESPGSDAQASCEAEGVPGITEDANRCGSTTPSPIASGIVQGTFGTYCENAIASTYNTSLVPDGADTTITVDETDADTTVQMIARGFSPNTEFTVTLHENVCGADASDAGAEYTDEGNPTETLVLDFTTDDGGGSTSSATVPWTLPDDGIGRSLLLSASGNAVSPGAANMEKVAACVSLER